LAQARANHSRDLFTIKLLPMSGKVVLGISAVCFASVLAARQKTGVEHVSSTSIVESIGSLLEQSDKGSHALSLIQQEMTPAVEQDVDAALKAAMQKIEAEVETKIKRGQEQSQQRLDEAYGNYERAATELQQTKGRADAADKAWYECIEEEQAQQQAIEAAQTAAAGAQRNQRQACQLMKDIDDFQFKPATAAPKFACEVAVQEDCQTKLAEFERQVAQMESEAASSLQEDMRKYATAKADCEAKTGQTAAAEGAITTARTSFARQQQQCRRLDQSRLPHICKAGKQMQAKCAVESKYQELLEQEAKEDEADRIREWQTTAAMKCLLLKYADGGMGDVADHDDLAACRGGDLGFERLKLKQEAFDKFTAAHQCKTGPVTFFNGQTWRAYKGRYTKARFTPSLILDGEDAFAFCANVGGVAVGEQNVENGGLGGGPLAPPEAQFEEGSVLHEIEGTGECEVSWATVPTRKAGVIDAQFHVGASLASWGCDRLQKAEKYGQLLVLGKAYAVVSCEE